MLNHSELSRFLFDKLKNSAYNLHDESVQIENCKVLASQILSAGHRSDPFRTLEEFKSRWLRFQEEPTPADRKTKIIRVYNSEFGHLLGEVRWYSPFRSYSFCPMPTVVFEPVCMTDIADYILLLMEQRQVQRNKEPKVVSDELK